MSSAAERRADPMIGKVVIARHNPERDDQYMEEARPARDFGHGKIGRVVDLTNAHGLGYLVIFDDGSAWYEPEELTPVTSDTAPGIVGARWMCNDCKTVAHPDTPMHKLSPCPQCGGGTFVNANVTKSVEQAALMKMAKIIDDVLPEQELAFWREVVKLHEPVESYGYFHSGHPDPFFATKLLDLARLIAGRPNNPARASWEARRLTELLVFNIKEGHKTEMHRDIGEYAVMFYPYDCPTGPLKVGLHLTNPINIEVKANRLVAIDATEIWHQQVIPTDGSIRRSIAFKFERW